jgi:hypothetical protein
MALSAAQVRDAWHQMTEADDTLGQTFTKVDLAAAVTAADAWATSNAASYNTALPDPFKSSATASQKAVLLAYVALKRWTG